MKITIYETLTDVTNPFHVNLEYVFERIKNGKTRELVEKIRVARNKEERDSLKKKLPCINFQGEFKERSVKGLAVFSGLMPLDYDNFPSDETLENTRSELLKSPYTYALFLSPSGNGLKQIVRIPLESGKADYKAHFGAAQEHFNSPYWDVSCSDISRLCFESYDAELYVNTDATLFTDKLEPEYHEIGTENPTFKITSDNRIIKNLLTWFHKRYRVASGQRNNNLFKLAIALNDYGVSQNEALATLMDFEQQGFGRAEIEGICRSAYGNHAGHGTLFFEDNTTKEIVYKQIRQGKSTQEIKKLLPEVNAEEIQKAADNIRSNIKVENYLYYDDNGKVKFNPALYKFWLEHNNFAKYYPVNVKTYTFVKIEGKIIEETDDSRIKDFVLDYLMSEETEGFDFYNYMAKNTLVFTPKFLSFLKSSEVKFKKDTKDACFIYFKNCIVKVTASGREILDYFDVEGFVWKNQILARDYVEMSGEESIFRKFVWLISGKNEGKYRTFQSVIGYLLHSFKTSANNKAIILNDSVISDNPNGGSGKGIFWNAISYMKKVDSLNGKDFELSKSFSLQTVSLDCQVLVFDDVERNFNFEKFFSVITEGITLERKNQPAIKLPIHESPRIVFTTNYAVGGVGGSFDRRKFEVELSPYFNSTHTPLDEFGHLLFDEWNENEWQKFDNYMLECEQIYLKNGLINCDFDNIEVKKFIRNTSSDFYEYTANHDFITFNVRLNKTEIFNQYVELYPDAGKNKLSQKTFKRYLEEYCKYYPNRYYSDGNGGFNVKGRWFMISTSPIAEKIEFPDDFEYEKPDLF